MALADEDGMYRSPARRGGLRQYRDELVRSAGRYAAGKYARTLADHIGLSVADLDAWHAKLKSEE